MAVENSLAEQRLPGRGAPAGRDMATVLARGAVVEHVPSPARAAVTLAVVLLWGTGAGIIALALPLYIAAQGHTPGQWGLLASAFALTLTLFEPFWGWAADRLGVAIPFMVSRACSAALILLLLLSGSFAFLVALQLLRGVVEVGMGPVGRQSVTQAFPPRRKATALGLFQGTQALGTGLGALLGGIIAGAAGFQAAFHLSAALAGAAFLVALLFRTRLVPPSERALLLGRLAFAGGLRGTLLRLARLVSPRGPARGVEPRNGHARRSFLALCVVGVCLYIGSSVVRSFLPLLGQDVLSLPPAQIGLLLTITHVASGLFMILGGSLSDRVGRRPLLIAGLLLTSAAMIGLAASHTLLQLGLASLAYALGFAAGVPVAAAWVSDIAPRGRQGQMIGLYGSAEDMGLLVGPALCGFAWDVRGPVPALWLMALLVALGLVAARFSGRPPARQP